MLTRFDLDTFIQSFSGNRFAENSTIFVHYSMDIFQPKLLYRLFSQTKEIVNQQ